MTPVARRDICTERTVDDWLKLPFRFPPTQPPLANSRKAQQTLGLSTERLHDGIPPVRRTRSSAVDPSDQAPSSDAKERPPRPVSFAAYRVEGKPRARIPFSRGLRSNSYPTVSRLSSQILPRAIPGEDIEQDHPLPQQVENEKAEIPQTSSTSITQSPTKVTLRNVSLEDKETKKLKAHRSKLWASLPLSLVQMGKRRLSGSKEHHVPLDEGGGYGRIPLTEENLRQLEEEVGSVPKIYTLHVNLLPTPVHSPFEIDSPLFLLPLPPLSSTLQPEFARNAPPSVSAKTNPDTPPKEQRIAVIQHADPGMLRSTTQICEICKDLKHSSDFPYRNTTRRCSHRPQICISCLQTWLSTCIETMGQDQCVCPECKEPLTYDDVKFFTTKEVFLRYDQLRTHAALSSLPNFHWCQSPHCSSGQIHYDSAFNSPAFTCTSCGHTYCLAHPTTPFHAGETCAQFEARLASSPSQIARRIAEEKANEKCVQENAKRCPNAVCGWWIEKNEGCDQMTCWKCQFQFCWECCAAFGPIRRKGNKFHRESCKYWG